MYALGNIGVSMSGNDAERQLSQNMAQLVTIWGLRFDSSGDSQSKSDVLQRCSIGDVAIVSKLKPRPLQAYADATSALGLRVVGLLSLGLSKRRHLLPKAPVPIRCCPRCCPHNHSHLYCCNQCHQTRRELHGR